MQIGKRAQRKLIPHADTRTNGELAFNNFAAEQVFGEGLYQNAGANVLGEKPCRERGTQRGTSF